MQHIYCILIMIVAEFTKISQLNHLAISVVKWAKYKIQEKFSCNSQVQAAAPWTWV